MNKEVLYYVRYANGTLDIMNGLTYEVLSDFNGGSNIEILDEVPDYYQYQNICKCLSEEHRGNSNLLEENEKLKKLLRKAKEEIQNDMDYTEFNEVGKLKLVKQIEQALGEE